MSRKKRKAKKQTNRKTANTNSIFKIKRRGLFKIALVAMLALPAYAAISAYNKNQAQLRDLSIIGQGMPTLVQVHDETCPSCRQLLSSVKAVKDEFPELEFRIADLRSSEGIKFSTRHQVSKVTLMFFDSDGKKLNVVAGLQTEQDVRSFIERMHPG
jgi:thioredoxin-like negative regulator of GroEL